MKTETNQVIVTQYRKSLEKQCSNISEYMLLDCTSHHRNERVRKDLSPFYIGPMECYDGHVAKIFENGYQFAKVYPEFADENGNPTDKYFEWRDKGFSSDRAWRFPFGKPRVPLYALWKINGEYKKLSYVQSRKVIYIPSYAKIVAGSESFKIIKDAYESGKKIAIRDFDGYNNYNYNMTMFDVVNKHRKMGHGFVIKMLLEGYIEVKDGEVIDKSGILKL
jgi:hypothetical protein